MRGTPDSCEARIRIIFYKQLRKLDGVLGSSYTKRRNKLKGIENS